MEILEFGNKEKEKIILLHGFQCPYQVWEDYIKYYENVQKAGRGGKKAIVSTTSIILHR